MKKKLISLLLVLVMPMLVLCGCNDPRTSKVGQEYNIGNITFVKVEQSGDFCILVDKETRVMYLYDRGDYHGGITALLNADGSPMLYEGEL